MQERSDDRSLGDLIGKLAEQVSTLVRQEIDLARTEISGKVSNAGRNLAQIGAGGAVAYAGFLALVYAAITLLASAGLDLWLSALVVGLVLAAAGGLLIQNGRKQIGDMSMAPERTIRTLKEDAEWASEQRR